MTKTASLAELILKAQKGDKFKAWIYVDEYKWDHTAFKKGYRAWDTNCITANWHYEEIKEPLKVEFECGWDKDDNGYFPVDYIVELSQLVGKKTKVTITEVVDD